MKGLDEVNYLKESFLLLKHVVQRDKHLICWLIYQHGMPVAERASSNVLSTETHLVPCTAKVRRINNETVHCSGNNAIRFSYIQKCVLATWMQRDSLKEILKQKATGPE